MSRILYKYLNITGGIMMLGNRTLQYTNASQLNDPFDCHPNLLDYSDIPQQIRGNVPEEWYREKKEHDALNLRKDTWLCSLSKINDSLLMWAHYCYNHKGICVGLDIDKVLACFPEFFGTVYLKPFVWEVHYQDIIGRPNFTKSPWEYQLMTKAKDWEYEQEVRLVLQKPNPMYAAFTPEQAKEAKKDKNKVWDWTEIRHYQPLTGDCFESIYLGAKIDPKEKDRIVKYAREKLNPDIKIYQMKVDETAFRLKAEEIN